VHRLLHPESVAIVGASERPATYSSETLRNLRRLGFEGEVWGVNPRRSSVYGLPCFPSLSDLPSSPDAVVVAIPAAGVPAVIEEAGSVGAGGAVVYAAGFGETTDGVALESSLRDAARRYSLPVCGPNCDGLISLWSRAALWGDALASPEPGHVALVSQSGNLVVNALATRRGLRLHTAVSSGNETVVTTPDWVEHLAREPDVRSIALLVEAEGDGARLCEALAVCADEGVGVAVLKVGASTRGAAAAAAHTGAVAGDHRVFRALMKEAGAAWAADVHDLLELAKALAVRRRRVDGGLAIMTCSGGDSGLGADEADRLGLDLPALSPPTVDALRARLPAAATVANPLDYTAMIWGEVDTLRDLIRTVGEDPAIGHVLVFYDRPPGITGATAVSWAAVEEGILAGAEVSPVPVMVVATLPELLDDESAWRFAEAGVPAIAGLRTGMAVAAALAAPPGDAARLRSLVVDRRRPGRWLAEHEAKALLRRRGVPVVPGRLVADEDDAVAAFHELGGRVAMKVSSAAVQHKTAIGGIALDIRDEAGVRKAFRQLGAVYRRISTVNNPTADPAPSMPKFEPQILVEEMVEPGEEVFVAARFDAIVPVLVTGRGGTDVERHDDVTITPLPTSEHQAIVAAADGLALIECNPVINGVVVDATAQEVAT
jgi:acetyl-CoA synthetase